MEKYERIKSNKIVLAVFKINFVFGTALGFKKKSEKDQFLKVHIKK